MGGTDQDDTLLDPADPSIPVRADFRVSRSELLPAFTVRIFRADGPCGRCFRARVSRLCCHESARLSLTKVYTYSVPSRSGVSNRFAGFSSCGVFPFVPTV